MELMGFADKEHPSLDSYQLLELAKWEISGQMICKVAKTTLTKL